MRDQTVSWLDFWKEETIFAPEDWSKSLEVFTRSLSSILTFEPRDTVLDVGCGPGYFARFLQGKVKEFHGLDISERYVETCREAFRDQANFHFTTLGSDYLDFSILGNRTFEKIICFSVVQYYRDQDELIRLIDEVRKFMHIGSKFLIGDIALKTSPGKAAWSSLKKGWQDGYLLKQLAFLSRAVRSNYQMALKQQGFLEFTEPELKKLVERVTETRSVRVQLLDIPLALKENRRHLLIEAA